MKSKLIYQTIFIFLLALICNQVNAQEKSNPDPYQQENMMIEKFKKERNELQKRLSTESLSAEEKSLIKDEVAQLNTNIERINDIIIEKMAGNNLNIKMGNEGINISYPANSNAKANMDSSGGFLDSNKYAEMYGVIEQLEKAKAELQNHIADDDLSEESRQSLQDAINKIDNQIVALQKVRERGDINYATTQKKEDTVKIKKIVIGDDFIKFNFNSNDNVPKPKKSLRNSKTQLLGLDLGENLLLDNGSTKMVQDPNLELKYPWSVNVSLYLLRQGVNLIKHKFYTTVAIGIDYHDYRFKNNITLLPKNVLDVRTDSIDFKKNKLSTQYLMVPLMLHYESNPEKPDHSFKMAIGGYSELLIKSYTKQVSDANGKQHVKGDFGLNNMAYGLIGQIGYGDLQFYTHYSLSSLFEEGKGPELYPITFGIVINGFRWN